MALLANTVSVGLGTVCLQRVSFELLQVAILQPGACMVVLR